MKKLIWVFSLLIGVRAWCPPGGPVTTPPGVANECPSSVSEGANCAGYERQWCVNYTTAIIYSCSPTTHVWMAVGSAGSGTGGGVTNGNKGDITVSNSGGTWVVNADAIGLTEMSDVTLTSPATGSVLIKGSPDWVDGQVNLADTDAVTGILPAANIDSTIARDSEVATAVAGYQPLDADDLTQIAALNVCGGVSGNGLILKNSAGTWVCGTDDTLGSGAVTGSGILNQIAYWNGTSDLAGDTGLFLDPATNSITATTFIGALSGNATTATSATTAGSATTATTATNLAADLTFSGVQQITSDRLLGRDTAAVGDIEQLSLGSDLEFTGSGGIQISAFSGDVAKSAGGTGLTIQDQSVEISDLHSTNTATDGMIASKGTGVDQITWISGTGGSPVDATYITQSSNNTLTAEQSLAALGISGIIKVTNTGGVNGTGVLAIASAGDFPTLNQNTSGTAVSVTGSFGGDVSGNQSVIVVIDNSHNHSGAAGASDTLSGIDISSDTNLSVTSSQGVTLTGDALALQDCAANQVLARNAGDTAYVCTDQTATSVGPIADPAPDPSASLIYVASPGTGVPQAPLTDPGLTYNASTDQLNAASFFSAQTSTAGSISLFEGSAGGATFWTLQAPANMVASAAVTGGSYTLATNTCVLNDDGRIPDECVGDGSDGGGAGVTDGDKGDITVATSGTVWTVDDDSIEPSDLSDAGTIATGYVPIKAATDVFTWTPVVTITETTPAAGHTLVWQDSSSQYINKLIGTCTGTAKALTFDVATLTFGCNTITVGGGVTLDLGDDAGNDSSSITEIATTGDTNLIFTESAADKLLIAVGNRWPTSDTALDLTCTNCIGGTEISTLALGSDVSGNYVVDVLGTANEITATHTPGSGSTATLSLPLVIDIGGKTSFELPNAAAPAVTVFGQIAGDNNLWGASRGAPIFYDGTASTALVNVLVSDTPSNGQVPKWNTGGTITWESDLGGSATAFSAITSSTNTTATMTVDSGAAFVFNTTTAGTGAITGTDTLAGLAGSGANLAANALTVGTTGIIYEGTTANAFQTLVTPGDPTADRTITLPNLSGTVSLTDTPQTVTGANTFTTNGIIWNTTTGGTAGMTGTDTLAGLSSALLSANAVTVGTTGLIFEGTTSNGSQSLLTAGEPTSDNTFTLPLAVSGTLISTGDTGTITSTMMGTEVRSMYWDAGAMSVDGTNCTTPAEVTINTGPKTYTVNCPNDSASAFIYGKTQMPDSWDGGVVRFIASSVNTNASPTGTYILTFSAQCVTPGTDTIGSTWTGTQTSTVTFATQNRPVAAATADLTMVNNPCAAGDLVFWRAISQSGTTTQEATVYVLGVKMEYTSSIGD